MTITALPTPPSRDDPSTFATRADAFLGALPTFATEANALASAVNADEIAAAASATEAEASANAAAASANVTKWVSGTTYTEGANVWSPITYLTYRRKTTGAGTTDPSADSANWAQVSGTGDVTAAGNNAFTGANTFYNATGQTFGTATSSQDGIILAGRSGGTSSYRVTVQPTTLSANRTLTLPNVTDTVATIGTAQTFTAAQTFRAANAIRSEAASTQDAVVVAGRAGGTSSRAVTITPTTLTASRTVTLPDADTTIPVATQVITFSGPTAARTYTLPDASTTLLSTNAAVTVPQGGTGLTTLTANNVILGNGTSAVQFVAPGTSGNVLRSNGTTWTSALSGGMTLLATLTPTAGTTSIAVTGLASSKQFVIVSAITQSGAWNLGAELSVNNGSSYIFDVTNWTTQNASPRGVLNIYNADITAEKTAAAFYGADTWLGGGIYRTSSIAAINAIRFYTGNGNTFSSGSIFVYGIN